MVSGWMKVTDSGPSIATDSPIPCQRTHTHTHTTHTVTLSRTHTDSHTHTHTQHAHTLTCTLTHTHTTCARSENGTVGHRPSLLQGKRDGKRDGPNITTATRATRSVDQTSAGSFNDS